MAHTVDWRCVEDYLKDAAFSVHRYQDRMASAIRCDVCKWHLDVNDYQMVTGERLEPICNELKAHVCKPILVKELVDDLEDGDRTKEFISTPVEEPLTLAMLQEAVLMARVTGMKKFDVIYSGSAGRAVLV